MLVDNRWLVKGRPALIAARGIRGPAARRAAVEKARIRSFAGERMKALAFVSHRLDDHALDRIAATLPESFGPFCAAPGIDIPGRQDYPCG